MYTQTHRHTKCFFNFERMLVSKLAKIFLFFPFSHQSYRPFCSSIIYFTISLLLCLSLSFLFSVLLSLSLSLSLSLTHIHSCNMCIVYLCTTSYSYHYYSYCIVFATILSIYLLLLVTLYHHRLYTPKPFVDPSTLRRRPRFLKPPLKYI